MRKRLLVSICVTVMLVAALAATAFAGVTVTGPDNVTTNSEIQIKVTGTMKGLSANITTTGLQFVSVNGGLSDEGTIILLDDYGGMEGTYTYKVTAASGQEVSFALTAVTESDGERDIPGDNLTWSGTVGGSFTTTTTQPTPTANGNAGTQNTSPAGGTAAAPTVGATDAGVPGAVTDGAATLTPVPTIDATAAEATPTVSAEATAGPHTADGSVNIWLLCIGAAACAVIAVLVGRKMFRQAR